MTDHDHEMALIASAAAKAEAVWRRCSMPGPGTPLPMGKGGGVAPPVRAAATARVRG